VDLFVILIHGPAFPFHLAAASNPLWYPDQRDEQIPADVARSSVLHQ